MVSGADNLAVGLLALADRGAGVPLRELALVGLTAAIVTYFTTGPVRVLATRVGAVAYPRERDVHVTPTPRMGGLAMYIGVVAAVFLASQLPALTRGFVYSTGMPAVVLAGGLIMGIGLIDDRWGLDALTKFAGQITAASVLVTMGVAWSVLYIPLGGVGTIVLDQVSSILLTLALTVSIVNAMNFVDGLDGLAAGLGIITALAICMFSVGLLRDHGGDVLFYPPAVISVVLAGACLGFLPHNFHPAKIFMGDSGSMLIGLMLAAASTTAAGPISQNAYGARDVFALLSPFLLVVAVMFVPMLDLLLANPGRPKRIQPRQDALASPPAADRSFASARGADHLSVGRHCCFRYRKHDLLQSARHRGGHVGRDCDCDFRDADSAAATRWRGLRRGVVDYASMW
jgi:UDP-GlcNAc:undecaprenyl-phosphate/decaprenyl-phosphate GlcNAc-1-phosphate transferase